MPWQKNYYPNQTGSIYLHNTNVHKFKPGYKYLREQTRNLYKSNIKNTLLVAEALLIKEQQPPLNEQDEGSVRVPHIF